MCLCSIYACSEYHTTGFHIEVGRGRGGATRIPLHIYYDFIYTIQTKYSIFISLVYYSRIYISCPLSPIYTDCLLPMEVISIHDE